jgi:hypothetical protein
VKVLLEALFVPLDVSMSIDDLLQFGDGQDV